MLPPSLLVTGCVFVGAAIFLYFYHFRTRSIDHQEREQVRHWEFYRWIDGWLKASTLVVTLLSLNYEYPWLLIFHRSWEWRLIGLIVAGLALTLFIWAMRTLAEQYTPCHVARVPNRLVERGPYRFIRHPVYAANLWLLSAMVLVSGSLWIVVNLVILICHYVPTIILEERAIAERMPEYEKYAQRTGRIFPRLWLWRSSDR